MTGLNRFCGEKIQDELFYLMHDLQQKQNTVQILIQQCKNELIMHCMSVHAISKPTLTTYQQNSGISQTSKKEAVTYTLITVLQSRLTQIETVVRLQASKLIPNLAKFMAPIQDVCRVLCPRLASQRYQLGCESKQQSAWQIESGYVWQQTRMQVK